MDEELTALLDQLKDSVELVERFQDFEGHAVYVQVHLNTIAVITAKLMLLQHGVPLS
jgi:hypothetical protein